MRCGGPDLPEGVELPRVQAVCSPMSLACSIMTIAAGAKGATVDSITVILTDRKEYKARLIGKDPASDLALLKIDATNLPFVRFGDSVREDR